MAWSRVPLSGGVYRYSGVFPEPSDIELQPYVVRSPRHRTARCGTVSGCAAHRRDGQIPCEACRKAERLYNRENRAKRARRSGRAGNAALTIEGARPPASTPQREADTSGVQMDGAA